jgi:predicted methyltransferase
VVCLGAGGLYDPPQLRSASLLINGDPTMKRHILFVALLWLLAPLGAAALDLDAPGRPQADHARDSTDHPVELLAFAGVSPGMSIADVFAGGGYWSELLSQQVGSAGKVVLYNNPAFIGFVGAALDERLAGGRLKNVTRIDAEAAAIGLQPASLDGALLVNVVHDFFVTEKDWDVTAEQVLPQLRAALKPGAFLLVMDHHAVAGRGTTRAQDLHRIEESAARATLDKYGFVFVKSSELQHNTTDDHTLVVFDKSVRGHTDRFVLLYRNPD